MNMILDAQERIVFQLLKSICFGCHHSLETKFFTSMMMNSNYTAISGNDIHFSGLLLSISITDDSEQEILMSVSIFYQRKYIYIYVFKPFVPEV